MSKPCTHCGADAVVTQDREGSPYTFCNHCGFEPVAPYIEDETGTYALDDCVYWETNTRGDCGGRLLVKSTADGTTAVCETCFNRPAENQPYVVKHIIPVWVHVQDGKVTRVVAEDDKLSDPLAIVVGPTADEGTWDDSDERPLTEGDKAQYAANMKATPAWPGWEWGF